MIFAALLLAMQLGVPQPAPSGATQVPAIVTRARLDTNLIDFRALVLPETVYVGQQATYQLGIFVDERARDRVRHMEAVAPEMRSMLAYDAPTPLSGLPTRTVGSRQFEVHVYQRAIFPLSAGRFVIPPAHLSYAMPLSYSFFSRDENFEVESDSVVVVAIDPPRASRPSDFSGAVGILRIQARLDTGAARVGDPMPLSVRVSGVGNIKLLPRPHLAVPWATAVAAGDRVSLASTPVTVRGTKEFDWILTPQRSGNLTLPSIRYTFFDPVRERYETAETVPQPLIVAPGALAAVDTLQPEHTRWLVRTTYRGSLSEPLYHHAPFWLLMALAPLPAAALLVKRRPKRVKRSRDAADALRALARPAVAAPPREVRRLWLRAVAHRLHAASVPLAEPAALERALRRAGTSRETAAEAATLLTELNSASFGPAPAADMSTAARAGELFARIDRESRSFRATAVARAIPVVVLVLALTLGSAWAVAAPGGDDVTFARGVAAYNHGHYREAARAFGGIAARVPRAADAWANLGTASWAAGDTARAVQGWQRALRLEPLAHDARERLAELAPESPGGPGGVPPLPARPIALLAAVLWIGGWLLLTVRLRRKPGRDVALALSLVVGAIALGGTAAGIDTALTARGLNVVSANRALHMLPVLAADPIGHVRVGEIAHVEERRGVWARISAGGGRSGWIDAASLLPLGPD
ncbi:MAG TPA: hypothetical protein VFW98_10225 [Gemmatimonadaceae bacterium]|nr:hypothetical protein [Gemmatimonadaceae bacterium]